MKKGIFLLNKKDWGHVLCIILICTFLGFLAAYLFPLTHKVTIAFEIVRVHQSQSEDYRYDGYYAIRASELFSDNITAWSKSLPVISEIFEQVHQNYDDSKAILNENFFRVRKFGPQLVQVSFSHSDFAFAQAIANAYIDAIQERAKHVLIDEQAKSVFDVYSFPPNIQAYRPSMHLGTILGCVIGLGLSLVYIYLRLSIYENRH